LVADYTNANGEFTIGGLYPGSYYVKATGNISGIGNVYVPEYYQESPDQTGAILVVVEGQTTGIDFTLEEFSVISGTVTRQDNGAVIPNTRVLIYDSNWDYMSDEYTDNYGDYAFDDLYPGSYYVKANGNVSDVGDIYLPEYYQESPDQAGATIVSVDGQMAGIDFTLDDAGIISGTASREDNGTLIANTRVRVYDSDWNYLSYDYTDSNGEYILDGLYPGSYYVEANGYVSGVGYVYYAEYYQESQDQSGATLLSVDGLMSGIDFTLEEGSVISGTVTRQDNGTVIASTRVEIYDTDWDYIRSDYTDSNGEYSVLGLYPGSYYVEANGYVSGVGYVYCPEYYQESQDQSGATLVAVDGQITGIDFTLEEGSVISGTVTRQDNGTVIANTRVEIYDTDWT